MIITERKPEIELGGQIAYRGKFEIGNVGRIMTILRNSMYANPIKAIVREISSNARDANREIGTPNRAIEIHIPNAIDPRLAIKDYGPGISHHRMDTVFKNWGCSTKNDDNIQTGGFGLGAKTPFAYSDQFSIVCVTKNDDGTKIKRTYIAYIDESKAGEIVLVSSIPTDEETGTEISLTIERKDHCLFKEAVREILQHWNPIPIISGDEHFSWPQNEIFIQGTNWKIIKNNDNGHYYHGGNFAAIVDGIEYPINKSHLSTATNGLLYNNFNFFLTINTGEITLAANREELQYDDKTKSKIEELLIKANSELDAIINDEFEKQPTYRDAIKFNSFCDRRYNNWRSYNKTWRGHKLIGYFSVIGSECFRATLCNNKLRISSITGSKDIDVGNQIIINDFERMSRSRVEKYLNNTKEHYIFIINSPDIQSIKIRNDSIDLSILNPVMMSSLPAPTEKKIQPVKRDRAKLKVEEFKNFRWQSVYIDKSQLDTGTGVYTTSRDKHDYLNKVVKFLDNSSNIFCIKDRQLGPGWVHINDAMVKKACSILSMSEEELINLYAKWGYITNNYSRNFIDMIMKLGKKYSSKEWDVCINDVGSIYNGLEKIDMVQNILGHKCKNFIKVESIEKLEERYPMLRHVYYNYCHDDVISDIIKYLKLVDRP